MSLRPPSEEAKYALVRPAYAYARCKIAINNHIITKAVKKEEGEEDTRTGIEKNKRMNAMEYVRTTDT